jgi:uncharacterized membrane protein YphA (DoxX/SURF4 family)
MATLTADPTEPAETVEPITPADPSRPRLAGWAGTVLRLAFGVVWAIDAVLKWLPGYRNTYVSQLHAAAAGQPPFLHGWFHFWITLQSGTPWLWVDLTRITETGLAVVLLLGVARRPGYLVGAGYMLIVWAVGEGFGGPYVSGATDIGAGIIYTLLFLTLLAVSPSALRERFSLDRVLAARHPAWKAVADLSPGH